MQVSHAQTVVEGNALEYTVTLNAPSRAGQVLKLETLVHNSRVPHDQLAKTADPFKPGEYLANGTVFTRNVKDIAVTPLGNSADISKHLVRLARYGTKYYENAELMKKLEALDRGEHVDIPETGNGAHPTALTALNKEAYNIPIYIVDSTDPNQTYAEFFSTDSRVLASADIMQHTMGRIPFPTHAQPANGGDKSFAVYDKGTGLMREYFHAEMDKGKWKVSSAGYHQAPAGLDELGAHNYWMQLDHGGSSVVMMLNPLSQIGISELMAGKINHAVSVTLPDAMIGRPSFPAKLSDGSDTFRHAAAEGQWFRIKPSVDLDSYTRKDADGNDKALNPLTLMIAKAAQQYGGYGADRNLHNIAFNAEPAHNYLAQGKEDPWRRGGELYEKLKAPGVNDPFSVNDFPWELVEWMPLDWNARGNDAGVYADENIRVLINGIEHTYPAKGGDIVLPEGVTDIRVKVPTLTHNNFIQTNRVELKAELLENGQSLATDNGSGQVVDAPSPFPDATPDADNSGNDILVSPKLNTAGFADLKTLHGEALYRYLAKHGAAILAQSEDGVAKTLDGGAGNDILISGRGIDLLKGGPGADTFVFIMNGENSQPYHSNDRILDFNPAEDRIILTRGQGWHQTDKVEFADAPEVQRLHFKTWLPPTNKPTIHINAVEIKAHDGRKLTAKEVLDSVRIYTEDKIYQYDGDTPVDNVSNQAPTDIELSANQIMENQDGAVVGTLSTTDPDANDTHTYSVSDQRFEVAGGELKLKAGETVNFAQEPQINLTITTTDSSGASYQEAFILQVQDDPNYPAPQPTNQAPTDITLSANQIMENQDGAVVGKLTTTDPDPSDTHTYTVSDARFEVDAQGQLKLKSGEKVNFNQEQNITLTITTTDQAGASYQEAFTLEVQDAPYGVYQHAEYGKYVDVREFGADASGAQSSDAAVKAALAAAQQEGASLYFGEGQYRLADPIRLNDALQNVGGIFGAGMDKTTLHYESETYSAITVNNLDGKKIGDFSLAIQTTFYKPGAASLGPVSGIMVLDSAQTTVQRVDVSGANGAGVRFAGDRSKHDPEIQKLINGDITADELDLGRGNQLIDSHLHHNRHSGALLEFQEHFTASGNTFARNGHEKDGNIGYGLALGVGSYNRHIHITNNTTDHNYRKGLDVHDGDHIVMENNMLNGDRLYGIAITSRTFAQRDITVRGNTVKADPAFHNFTDDNTTSGMDDYIGIEVQTNYFGQNFPDARPASITIADNRIENLFDPGSGGKLSHGIHLSHRENETVPYTFAVTGNHISGSGADHAIAVFNHTTASGNITLANNTIALDQLAHAPIRVHNSTDGSGQALSGSLTMRDNSVHLGAADNSAEILLVEKHRAQDYDIRNNTLTLDNRIDQPLIILRPGDYSGKAQLTVADNRITTPLSELPKQWINAGDALLTTQGNTHNGQAIADAALSAADQFAQTHLSPGENYLIAANPALARLALAEYEAEHGKSVDYLILSDGSHHALLQRGGVGEDVGVNGFRADFAKAGYIPMIAYFQNNAAEALNQALATAARLKLGVEMPDHGAYALTAPVNITNGVTYLHGNGSTLTVQLADTGSNANPRGAIEISKGTQNAAIRGLHLDMQASQGAEGILGYDAEHIVIANNHITHLAGATGNAAAGITFYNGESHVRDIRIENNRIHAQTGDIANKGQVLGISFVGTTAPHNPAYLQGGDPIWQQYIADGSVRPLDASRTMQNIHITGNQIDGGYYGVNLFAVTDSLVQHNHIGNNTRNISLQNNASRNTVADNLLTDALSSAVHIAYNADHNTIRNNIITSDRLSGQALLQAYQGSDNNTFANNRIEALHNAAARLMYTGTNDGGNHFTNNIASGRTAASAFGAEAVWDKNSAQGDPSAYASNMQDRALYNGDIRHGGGFGPMRDTVFANNILAPEITQRPVTPIIYLAADHSSGQDGSKNIRGDLDITLNGNILLGADNAPETIRQHQNGATLTLSGDGILRDADGVYQSSQHIAYTIRDYQMTDTDQHLYLLGNDAINGQGNSADNSLIGNGRANTLSGGAGNDTLDGGYGADTLTGGQGADTFVFQSKIDGQNLDRITDFNRAEGDKIALSEIVFGQLDGDWFAKDGETHTHATRIYQQGDTLYHDLDGSGSQSATAFAHIGTTALDAQDFNLLNTLWIV